MPRRPYHASLYRFGEPQPSYWEQTAGARDLTAAALSADATCDVAVIGGGYTGLSTALHLARDFHIDVRVLEAGHLGWGASGRNGGFCSIGGTFLSPKRQLARYGLEQTRRYYRAQVEAVELVRSLAADEGMDIQPQGDGELLVAHSPAAYRALGSALELNRRTLGLRAELIPRAAFREQCYDASEQFGALKVSPGFGLHPLRYLLGLARAAERRGARLHPHSEVLGWRKEGAKHVLETGGGRLRADRVVVACNGFMPEHLHPGLAARVLPVQSNIIVTRPLSAAELAAQRWQTDCPAASTRHLYFYFRVLKDRRLMLGGRGDASGHPDRARRLDAWMLARVAAIWPGWRDLEITHRWRGLVCFTRSLRPAVGRLPGDASVYVGYGYHGNGVNTATWVGRELACWLAGGNDPAALHPPDLPAAMRGATGRFPLPGLRRLYLEVGLSWFKLLDRIESRF